MAREIELVTAYFHIPSKNPKEFYLKHAEAMLSRVNTHITLFTCKENAKVFKTMRGDLPITIISDDVGEDGLPENMPIKTAFDNETWQLILKTLCLRSKTRGYSKQLLQLWLSKSWFVEQAISITKEKHNKVFVWCDIGGSKNIRDYSVFEKWPSRIKLFLRGYEDNKIIFYQRRNQIELKPDLESGLGSVIAGSHIIGTDIAWQGVFEDVIKQAQNHALKFNFDGIIDETVYYGLVLEKPEKYRMERVYWAEPPLYNYGWYETFHQDIDNVNPLHNIQTFKNICFVKDFLNNQFAKKLAQDLKNVDKTWWNISMFPSDAKNTKLMQRYSDMLEKDQEFQNKKVFNKSVFNQGNFSYLFQRSAGGHFASCSCIMCSLPKHFNSKEFKYALSSIVEEEVTELNETFCSKYEKGDYLSIHHDKGKGDYAFVYQLTEHWNPSFGGLLHFYDSKSKEIYKTVNPLFNSLTIFRIKDVEITDHFVSENTSNNIRYAFTGWFSVKKLPVATFIVPSIGRNTLTRTIDSLLLLQNPNWNAIVGFDGISEDVIKELGCLSDKRIRYETIKQKKGQGKNFSGEVRNWLIQKATTPWICFVDDDDTVRLDYIDKLLEEISMNSDAQCIVFRMSFDKLDKHVFPPLNTIEPKLKEVGISFAVKKEFLDTHSLQFRNGPSEDFDLLQKIYNISKKFIIFSKHIVYNVRF
jgi:Rps23 Pro-64 3,4-dihydroxylase Tpa1-like proline 4-hydroxylase